MEKEPTMNDQAEVAMPLITKYRPGSFDEVFGHEAILTTLRRAMKGASRPHAYLFTGLAGLGKTTLARIVAGELECEIEEIDAASNSGVDSMRELVELGQHLSFGSAGRKAFIIDECHALSNNAWQAILKLLEEPPAHLFLMLCTTELRKVPETIRTRCFHAKLEPLKPDVIEELLCEVIEAENMKITDDVLQLVVVASTGQPRKALSLLQAVDGVQDKAEARRIIGLFGEGDPLHDLCKLIVDGKGWEQVKKALAALSAESGSFDQASIALGRYLTGCIDRAKTEKEAAKAWALLDALLFPTAGFDPKASFYAAIGRILWGAKE